MNNSSKAKGANAFDDDENVSPNPRRRTSGSKRPSPRSGDSSSSSEDDGDHQPLTENRKNRRSSKKHKQSTTTPKKKNKKKTSSGANHKTPSKKHTHAIPHDEALVMPIPAPSRAEKRAILQQITSCQEDRNLQVVLWEIDCNYTLLEHQFKGVRALAGVPDGFPGKLLVKTKTETEDEAIFYWTVKVLRNAQPRRQGMDRGILMADVMGLGKTVQAVAACMLRNAISMAKDESPLPTLIVSPNDAVLTQWHETLIKAGVLADDIYRFAAKDLTAVRKDNIYLLCNRYDLQTEMRHVFSQTKEGSRKAETMLFPHAPRQLMLILKNQYDCNQGRNVKNLFKPRDDKERMNPSKIVTQCLHNNIPEVEPIYRSVVIDEAHFLKSILTYWGIGAGLLGLHSERMIPMSGTPYNNSVQDMASIMTMINPSLESAYEDWWKEATKDSAAAKSVLDAISEWTSNFVIRRDKSVIASKLPKKVIQVKQVAPYPLELTVYDSYEGLFMKVLSDFRKAERGPLTPFKRRRLRELMTIMMALASCMRLALIHPVLPKRGRDCTVFFSPTRRKMPHVIKNQVSPDRCVCCPRKLKKKKKEEKKKNDVLDTLDDEGINGEDDDFDDLADFIVADDHESEEEKDGDADSLMHDSEAEEDFRSSKRGHPKRLQGSGDIVEIPDHMCELASMGIQHYACETCLEALEESGACCPQCASLRERLKLDSGRNELLKKKAESAKQSGVSPKEVSIKDFDIPRKVYCADILGGFKASAKLESIVEDLKAIPKDEKVLIVSFFKGSLDLLEAIFFELQVEVARFDGDIPNGDREEELRRFKNRDSCRVLLMTVQTGGTGLNLVCANHVWFLDRFWNPMVMEQAEDRCYRLGQNKDVDVTYYDVSFTIDVVMRKINEDKSNNAAILLADGSKLSTSTAGLSFKDISGCLGNSIRAVQLARVSFVQGGLDRMLEPLRAPDRDILENVTRDPGGRAYQRQAMSMMEAMAAMLGYTPAPISPTRMTIRGSQSGALPLESGQDKDRKPSAVSSASLTTGDIKPTPMDVESSGTGDEDRKPSPPEAVSSSATLGVRKPSPMEIESVNEDAKPKTSSKAKSAVKKEETTLPDSNDSDDDDDDDIPDAVNFKSKSNK